MRSFQIVEDKILESDFFLEKLKECDFNTLDARFYLSAFLSSSRSITFCLQASLKDLEGFEEWYAKKQEILRDNDIAKFFLQARNDSQKVGLYHINSGTFYKEKDGTHKVKYYFKPLFISEQYKYVPEEDLVTACEIFFKILIEIIYDCFQIFGNIIDPEQFWTLRNLANVDISKIEKAMGFPKGWTEIDNLSITVENEDIDLDEPLTKDECSINHIFPKYLGKDKFGNKITQI